MDLNKLKGGLVVSCQAHFDHPLNEAQIMARMAESAKRAGAVGIRANGVEHIREIKQQVELPIIGIYKVPIYQGRFFITPTFDHAKAIAEAGADIIALEATEENQPSKEKLGEFIHRIHEELQVKVMADISTYEEGIRAFELGADLVGTTLSGYTKVSEERPRPDLPLVKKLSDQSVPTVCEGHIRTPEQAKDALESGAFFVVVGTAITDPLSITQWYVEKLGSK